MDKKKKAIGDYFDESGSYEPDNNEFSDPGSEVEFYDGDEDFIIPETTSNYEPPDTEESDPEDFEPPEINIPDLNFDTYFDTAYYLEQNPDVAASGMNPLSHFINFGAAEGRAYRSNNFDTAYYLEQNPDVAAAGIEPFMHYLLFGKAEGRAHRGIPTADFSNYDLFYTAQYSPEVNDISIGAGENLQSDSLLTFNTNYLEDIILFDREYYLEQNSDVETAGVDPYLHYFQSGQAEGRNPYNFHKLFIDRDRAYWEELDPNSYLLFDREYYLEQNSDVEIAGIDPYEHYTQFGQAEGRDPFGDFQLAVDEFLSTRNPQNAETISTTEI